MMLCWLARLRLSAKSSLFEIMYDVSDFQIMSDVSACSRRTKIGRHDGPPQVAGAMALEQ